MAAAMHCQAMLAQRPASWGHDVLHLDSACDRDCESHKMQMKLELATWHYLAHVCRPLILMPLSCIFCIVHSVPLLGDD